MVQDVIPDLLHVDDVEHSDQGIHVCREGVQLRDADLVVMVGIHHLLEGGSGTRGLSTCMQSVSVKQEGPPMKQH